MYFVSQGECEYQSGISDDDPVSLSSPAFIGEAVLWMAWAHRGSLTTHLYCELIAVDAQKFQDVITHGSRKLSGYRHYCTLFCDELLTDGSSSVRTRSDVTDLSPDIQDLEEMVLWSFPGEDASKTTELSKGSKWTHWSQS